MSLNLKSVLEGFDELQRTLAAIPERVQMRVLRLAGRKAGTAIAKNAMEILRTELHPRQSEARKSSRAGKQRQWYGALRDSYINKQKVYRSSGTTVNIIGGRSGPEGNNRVNHLIEDGTADRWHNMKSEYRRVTDGVITSSRKVKTASGGYRTVKYQAARTRRVSIGSRAKSGGRGKFTGRVKAHNQLARAASQTPVAQIMETEIRAGLQRIADRS